MMKKIKIYLIFALSLVLVGSLYTRFGRGKAGPGVIQTPASPPPQPLQIPNIDLKNLRGAQGPSSISPDFLRSKIKDIFKPFASSLPMLGALNLGDPSPEREKTEPAAESPPSLKLKGTIVGGAVPIAIIDDQFVRPGDMIGGYKVVLIGKRAVHLDSGDKQLTLELLKNE